MYKRSKHRRAVYSKTEPKAQTSFMSDEPEIPQAQYAKRMLREVSMDCGLHFDDDEEWGDSSALKCVHYNYKEKNEKRTQFKLKSKRNPQVSASMQNRFYLTNPPNFKHSKTPFLTQYHPQTSTSKARSYSSIKMNFEEKNKKDQRIHSSKKVSCSNKALQLNKKQILNFTSERCKIEDKRVYLESDVQKEEVDIKERAQQQSLRTTYKSEKEENKYIFGLVFAPSDHKIVPVTSGPKRRGSSKRASLISSMLRNEIKKRNEQARLKQKRIRILSQKGMLL